jgi:hypothetical protein
MILGIVSIPLCCGWGIGFIPGIVAITLSTLAWRQIKASNGTIGGMGFAIAGLSCGIVGTLLGLISLGVQIISLVAAS